MDVWQLTNNVTHIEVTSCTVWVVWLYVCWERVKRWVVPPPPPQTLPPSCLRVWVCGRHVNTPVQITQRDYRARIQKRTFNKKLCPRGHSAVFITGRAHILSLVVNSDAVNHQRAVSVLVIQLDVVRATVQLLATLFGIITHEPDQRRWSKPQNSALYESN